MPSRLLNQLSYEEQTTFVTLLQQLLAIPVVDLKAALDQAGHLVGEAFQADKVDILLYDTASDSLVAMGTNETPMAQHQRELGLNRLPLAQGGRAVEVFQTGMPYVHGQVDKDEGVLPGFRIDLGIRSMTALPLDINGVRRGCVTLSTARPDCYRPEQLPIFQAVTHWISFVVHQAELVEQLAREAAEQARRRTAEELITVMAHDLKNYLTPLSMSVQTLRRHAERDERANDVRVATQAMRAVEQLSALIHDLLDVSRLDHGLFTLDIERFNITELVQNLVDILATPRAPIQLHTDENVYLWADPDRLRQAVHNLLANAQQHTPPGTPITMSVRTSQDADGQRAIVEIRDQGPGISQEQVGTLFTRFARGKTSQGLGLGLYLAHTIATLHGGTLTVVSQLGAGSTFRLSLPIQHNANNEREQIL